MSTETEIKPFITTISYKQALLGVLIAIGSGYGFLFITDLFLDPLLISTFNWSLMNFANDLYILRIPSPNMFMSFMDWSMVNLPSYMYFVSLGFAFVTDIPTCIGWLFGGIAIGIVYKRKNAYFNGVKGSLKSFQIVIIAIELIFIGSSLYYLVSFILDSTLMLPFTFADISLLLGGLILFLLTLFISPGFWLSLSFVLIGGIIGSKFPKGVEPPPPVKKKVPIEAAPTAVTPTIGVEAPAATAQTTEAMITQEVISTGKCPKCKSIIPSQRIAILQEGRDSFCPSCMQQIKGVVIEAAPTPATAEAAPNFLVSSLEIQNKRNEIKEIINVAVELLNEDREKARAFFQDALDLARSINAGDLIQEIEKVLSEI